MEIKKKQKDEKKRSRVLLQKQTEVFRASLILQLAFYYQIKEKEIKGACLKLFGGVKIQDQDLLDQLIIKKKKKRRIAELLTLLKLVFHFSDSCHD